MNNENKYSLEYAMANSIQDNKEKIEKLEKKNQKLQKQLQKKNKIIDEMLNYGIFDCDCPLGSELGNEENNKLSHLVANKVIADYDYDSILKRELNEEIGRNIVLEESKNMTKKVLNEFEKWLKESKTLENWEYGDMFFGEFCDIALDKLHELKGDKDE